MFYKLYQKSLKLAAHKSSKIFLSIVAFAESSFFPVPPDIMIVPMIIAKRRDYLKIFLIATLSSAIGGLFGYLIGAIFIDFGIGLVDFYGYQEKVIALKNNLKSGQGFFLFLGTLFLAGFTPLPFKVFTITSGVIGFNIFIFFFICLFSRGIRFFVVSYLTYKFGFKFDSYIKQEGSKLFIIGILIIFVIATTLYSIIK